MCPGTQIVSVTLATQPATIISGDNCAVVVVEAQPFGANVTGDIVLVSDTHATVTRVDGWTYLTNGSIDSVSLDAGQAGAIVNIRGTNLMGGGTGVRSVTFAGTPAFVSPGANDTFIACRVLVQGSGTGDVVVTGDSGVVVRLVDGWTFSEITTVSPSSGHLGTVVEMGGVALLASGTNVTGITLAGITVESIDFVNATRIRVCGYVDELCVSCQRTMWNANRAKRE